MILTPCRPPQVYNPYGHSAREMSVPSLLAYASQCLDQATGCYLLGNGHRAYNPVLMRFLSPDRLSPLGAGGMNAYSYCLGDPINHLDPSGKVPLGWAWRFARRAAVKVAEMSVDIAWEHRGKIHYLATRKGDEFRPKEVRHRRVAAKPSPRPVPARPLEHIGRYAALAAPTNRATSPVTLTCHLCQVRSLRHP